MAVQRRNNDGWPDDESAERGWRPVPDPTKLTTAQLLREISALKEIVFTRLDGMDKAVGLFKDDITRVPTDTDKQIQQLKTLILAILEEREKSLSLQLEERDRRFHNDIIKAETALVSASEVNNEKFASVNMRFNERDVRAEQSARDNKVSVDAALTAAKELVTKQNDNFTASIAKSEAATFKQIDQQGQLITNSYTSLNDKIDDLKQRVTAQESRTMGKEDGSTHARLNTGLIVTILVAFMTLIFLALALFALKRP